MTSRLLCLCALVSTSLLAAACGSSDAEPSEAGAGGSAAAGASGAGGSVAGGASGTGGTSGASGAGGQKPALCPGATAPMGQTCHDSQECPAKICVLEIPKTSCGGAISKQCGAGSPMPTCPTGFSCETTSCGNTQCIPTCSPTSCPADQVCGASGLCQPKPCADGYVCPEGTACGLPGGDAHGCGPKACGADYTCPTGYVCAPGDTADGHGCSEVSCKDGFTCPENSRCKGTGSHGCEILDCKADAECDCGACVTGKCAPHVGVCYSPPA